MSTTEISLTSSKGEAQSSDEGDVGLILDLSPQMQRFVHLYMTGQYTLSKIAQLLDIHPNTAGKWLRLPQVQEVITDMQITTHNVVNSQLKALTLKAVNRLSELTESPIDGVALQAVKDVLDRGGHKAKQEIKIDKTVTTIEQKMKELINETIVFEDVDYEDVSDE